MLLDKLINLDDEIDFIKLYRETYLNSIYIEAISNKDFFQLYKKILNLYLNRPTLLYNATNLSEYCKYGNIWIKREDTVIDEDIHNIVGFVLIAKKLKMKKIVISSIDGVYGIKVAKICCLFKLKCIIYMNSCDIINNIENVSTIKLLRGKIKEVKNNSINESLKYWFYHFEESICLTEFKNPNIPNFDNIIGDEIYYQLKNIDIIVINNIEDIQEKYAIFNTKNNNIKWVSSNPLYQDNSHIRYIKGNEEYFNRARHLFIFNEGIIPKLEYSSSIYCAIKIAKSSRYQNKNILLLI